MKPWWAAVLFASMLIITRYEGTRSSQNGIDWGLQGLMENQMLAWEAAHQEGAPLPAWLRSVLQLDQIPVSLEAHLSQIENQTDPNQHSHLMVEWALVCHRLSLDGQGDAWQKRALDILAKTQPSPEENLIDSAIRSGVQGLELPEADRRALVANLQHLPLSWWTLELARLQGVRPTMLPLKAEQVKINGLRDGAIHALLLSFFVRWALPVLLLALFWRSLRRLKKVQPLPASSQRLFALWTLTPVLGLFSLAEIIRFGTFHFIGPLLAALLPGTMWLVYWTRVWIGYLLSIARSLLTPTVLKFTLTRRMGTLRRAFGFSQRDLMSESAWALSLACVGLFTLIFHSINAGLIGAKWMAPPLDFLSRSLNYLGEAALPAHLAYGCFVAPLVEELTYRGFLFTVFSRRWGAMGGALLSSALFAYAHSYSGWASTITFVFGLLSCRIYRSTGRLASCFIFHGLVNMMEIFMLHCLSGG